MALPPADPSEIFVREVDENLRRDQARDFLKDNGLWIVGALLLFLAIVAGWLYWRDRQYKEAQAATERLNAVLGQVAAGQTDSIAKPLAALEQSDAEGVSAAARLIEAAVALEKSDRKSAMAQYRALLADDSLAQPYHDLATIRLTALEFDAMKPADVIARLAPLAEKGNPWFGSAGEMTAMAMLKLGRKGEAGRMFAAIAADNNVPQSIRSRAVQIAGSLGVDATASLPATARQD